MAATVKTEKLKILRALRQRTFAPALREPLIILAFVALTALMTWPWVTRMRDAVVDSGDPYLVAWMLWWDYHQTFTDPLKLFDANIFYPLPYTLAYSENCYGVALLFFPLFAIGLRPLTVHSVATFLGFAFCGYSAFRLTRTLTKSDGAAWVAGIIFAFVPYRFHLLSQLHYVFAGWIPLVLEALVLFARERTRKRAAWLAVAFVMNALTCLTWFIVSLVPLALTALLLIVRYRLWRDRDFWLRGTAAMCVAALVLLPFLYPYYYVSKTYHLTWGREVVERNSPTAIQWLAAEQRNKLWKGFGEHIPNASNKLFPGLLPILLALAAVLLIDPFRRRSAESSIVEDRRLYAERASGWVYWLDAVAVIAFALALVSAGWAGAPASLFSNGALSFLTSDRALFVVALAVLARLSVAYPHALRRATGEPNLIANLQSSKRGEGFWIGMIWAAAGFFMSLGTNSLFYRVLFDFVFLFRGMRLPARAAMLAYVGLAILAGVGARRLASVIVLRRPSIRESAVVACIAALLLFELRAAPLRFIRGAVYPDEITLRLKETPMRGGLVELPIGTGELPHLYMLRAADHGRPLINAISTFVPPHASQINDLSLADPIPLRLLDHLEEVPTSYLVIHNRLIAPEQRARYEAFLMRAIGSGRLRFINRFGEGDDLYAVTKTEPDALAEAAPPFDVNLKSWPAMLEENPTHLLGQYQDWGLTIYRFYLVSFGRMPRMSEFMPDVLSLGRGVVFGGEGQEEIFTSNARAFTDEWVARPDFDKTFRGLPNEEYVQRLLMNAGSSSRAERDSLVASLNDGTQTRASVLRKVVDNQEFKERERVRGLVLLHYFAYLRRNPDDAPDKDWKGFEFWVREVETSGDLSRLGRGFATAFEYKPVGTK